MTSTVCFIHPARYPDQGSVGFFEYTRHLAARTEYDVHAITLGHPTQPASATVGPVHLHRIALATEKPSRRQYLRFIQETLTLLDRIAPDIAHVYFRRGCFALANQGRKTHPHTRFVLDVRSSNLTRGVRKEISRTLNDLEAQFFDAVCALDQAIWPNTFRWVKPSSITILPLGVDVDHFAPQESSAVRRQHGIEEDHQVLLHTGAIDPRRRLSELVRAFATVRHRFPRTCLMFVGKGSDVDHLQTLSRQLGVADGVLFTGYVDYQDVPRYVNAADIGMAYVPITPEYDPQPPTKTLEYLACGLPVVATDTTGNRRYITDGWNGLLCGDHAEDLAKTLITVLSNAQIRKIISRNARESVASETWQALVENRLISLYCELLE
jgi:glycosyltransferase involved in cell wall biosynthesis